MEKHTLMKDSIELKEGSTEKVNKNVFFLIDIK
jgi:hypothetical protein